MTDRADVSAEEPEEPEERPGAEEPGQEEAVIPITDRQPLWPLLSLSLALTVLGFYMALRPELASLEPRPPLELASPWLELPEGAELQGSDRGGDALELAYRLPHTMRRRYELTQVHRRARPGSGEQGEGPRAEIAMRFDAAFAPAPGEADPQRGVPITITITSPRLAIRGDQGEAGQDVLPQLEELLEGLEARAWLSPIGALTGVRWQGSQTNPQVHRMLRLIEDALTLFQPRLPRAEVLPGEGWSYGVGFPGQDPGEGLELEGGVDVDSTLRGQVVLEETPLAFIEQELRVRGAGSYTDGGGEGSSYELEGRGEAVVYFNDQLGALARHELVVEQTLRIEPAGGGQPFERLSRIEVRIMAQR